ncbi:hypothetical protein G9A89_020532 [Geosiphon pyriformis]|nr:hypothetical protein G9A89_020532 [Geosiphon pyriformis]
MCDKSCQYTILISNWVQKEMPIKAAWRRAVQRLNSYPHDNDKIWRMALVKTEEASPEEIKMIKDNSPEPLKLDWDAEPIINLLDPEQFYEHYQELASTKEEQEQQLEQLNAQLCQHCLIPCDFQYCDECNLIYNPLPCMIYTISEEKEPISSCASESESPINCDPDFDDDDKNTSSSSIQNGNNNKNDSNSDSNSDLNYEKYIILPDLFKKQELKWYSDNGKDIMPERAHNTDAGFDLRNLGKDAIKLKPNARVCIDLKIALEIPVTTMVLLALRSSLVKKKINIRGEIVNAGYTRNISAMLQNDSKKTYTIELNEKIAQAIFLPLVKVASLVEVGTRKELGITARGIQGFGSTDRIDVPVNMAEEKIADKGEIIFTSQPIFILPYDQHMVVIEQKIRDQDQIFEAESALCESEKIGLVNLHIPVKNHNHIKIPIYNNTGSLIEISAETIIGYLSTEVEDQLPYFIPDFSQLCGYIDITSQTIYR